MKIQGPTGPSQAPGTRKTKSTSSTGSFSESAGTAKASESQGVFDVADLIPTEALLSIQEALTLSSEDRESVQNGHKILDDLEQIHKGILLGHFSKTSLEDLVGRIRVSRQKATLPELENLLEQIELRAEVELAKLSYLSTEESR